MASQHAACVRLAFGSHMLPAERQLYTHDLSQPEYQLYALIVAAAADGHGQPAGCVCAAGG
jgi:hypothetical protein